MEEGKKQRRTWRARRTALDPTRGDAKPCARTRAFMRVHHTEVVFGNVAFADVDVSDDAAALAGSSPRSAGRKRRPLIVPKTQIMRKILKKYLTTKSKSENAMKRKPRRDEIEPKKTGMPVGGPAGVVVGGGHGHEQGEGVDTVALSGWGEWRGGMKRAACAASAQRVCAMEARDVQQRVQQAARASPFTRLAEGLPEPLVARAGGELEGSDRVRDEFDAHADRGDDGSGGEGLVVHTKGVEAAIHLEAESH